MAKARNSSRARHMPSGDACVGAPFVPVVPGGRPRPTPILGHVILQLLFTFTNILVNITTWRRLTVRGLSPGCTHACQRLVGNVQGTEGMEEKGEGGET